MLEVNNLHFRYDSKGFRLEDVSLRIEKGYFYTLVGENGSGKTTLLNLLYGIRKPKRGEIRWKGEILTSKNLPKFRQSAAYVGEEWCDTYATPEANVRFLKLLYPAFDEEYFNKMVRKADLEWRLDCQYNLLSAGEQVKMELAFALARKPELLILDEPLAGLDPVFKTDILELLQSAVAETGMTIFMATNLVTEVEDVTDFTGEIRDGRLVRFGSRLDAAEPGSGEVKA